MNKIYKAILVTLMLGVLGRGLSATASCWRVGHEQHEQPTEESEERMSQLRLLIETLRNNPEMRQEFYRLIEK